MEEGKRQRQVASVIKEYVNEIFQHLGLSMYEGGLISISDVKVTPDLLEARIYVSFFKIENKAAALKKVEDRAWEIKKLLSEKMRHQLRRIPVIHYYEDDTLDNVFRMEDLFEQIKKEDDNIKNQDNA
ncbi:30S ribosome-binding factor RbfA [Rhizosphaericola mali]|uniref:Ribosome-binding factor A n=1 Tax=Rhizosphaericola mali TaxID=2545455 RepID=A0A5P2G265_9BACT|nr:30S ribosome-binding factor RbfA [Rhizosphaericola mali]QES89555.1 30S ribosome-binding factor RbfA [Rhizosphaericola mali]